MTHRLRSIIVSCYGGITRTAYEVVNDFVDMAPGSGSAPEAWAAWRARCLSDVEDILEAAGVAMVQTDADLADAEGDREHDRRKGT